MTQLTDLGIASIRDGFRSGDFSAREVADAFNAAVAGAKALNAFIVETPDHAIAAAEQADRDRSEGTFKALSGVPIGWDYPAALGNPSLLDTVPHPEYGNRLTIRQYQQEWLAIYQRLAGGALPIDGCELAGGGGITGIGSQVPADIAPVIAYAQAQLGKPYVWGGAGPDVFDCSGLTLRAYQQIAVNLPHKSAAQANYGVAVNWRSEPIRPGDLIFHRGSVPVHDNGHVGIAISATQWIVAPKTGDVVSLRPIPFDRVQTVRRLVQPIG